MRPLLLGILLLASQLTSVAQDTTKFKPRYMGMFLSGAQLGCTNCSLSNKITFSAQAVNGIQLSKRFSVGLGVGLDTYDQWKTMPVFIHVSQKLMGRKNGLLVQFSSGYAFGFMDKLGYELSDLKECGGMMYHPAIVYQFNYYRLKIYFSAGIKYQTVSYSTSTRYTDFYGSHYSETNYTTDLRRAVFQVGFGW
jgi:hypothetical protein